MKTNFELEIEDRGHWSNRKREEVEGEEETEEK